MSDIDRHDEIIAAVLEGICPDCHARLVPDGQEGRCPDGHGSWSAGVQGPHSQWMHNGEGQHVFDTNIQFGFSSPASDLDPEVRSMLFGL